jgi:hypothetical protein
MSVFIFAVVSVVSLAAGVYVFLNPEQAFEVQRKFYLMINWEIKPVDWEKEMRNTQIMAAGLIVFTVAAILYFFFT